MKATGSWKLFTGIVQYIDRKAYFTAFQSRDQKACKYFNVFYTKTRIKRFPHPSMVK